MERKVEDVQEYLRERGIKVAETSTINAAIDIARQPFTNDLMFFDYFKEKEKKKEMADKIKEIQEYLRVREIKVTETSIINAAITIATRGGGNEVFLSEFKKDKEEQNEDHTG